MSNIKETPEQAAAFQRRHDMLRTVQAMRSELAALNKHVPMETQPSELQTIRRLLGEFAAALACGEH